MPKPGLTPAVLLLLWIAALCGPATVAPAQSTPVRLPPVASAPLPAGQAEATQRGPSERDREPDAVQWWQRHVGQSVWDQGDWVSFDLNTLLVDTLRHSPRILGVGLQVEVALAEVVHADAAFDARTLLESRYGRTSDPVGNTLVTGGPPRLREGTWNYQMGLRQDTRLGGQWNVSQQLGLLSSNSVFLTPANQGNSRFSISLAQPLLSGAGRLYNQRLLLQAQIEGNAAWQQTHDEVQQQIAEVMAAYWRLYELRCRLLQQNDLLQRGLRIERIVAGRCDLDTGRVEQLRAAEQVSRRRDRLLRTEAELRNEQTRLAALVGAPQLLSGVFEEMIPRGQPRLLPTEIDLREALLTGLRNRPDIRLAATQLESASLQVQVTRNQLLPQLNALVETYVAGLNGNRDAFGSFADQFTQGEPGFAAGVQMDLPIGRRGSQAKHRAARAEMQREVEAMRLTVLEARAEIETAVREVAVSMAQGHTRQRTVEATLAEEHYLQCRWESLAGDRGSVGLVLQDLLDSQQRRTDAEEALVAAEVGYLMALIRLQVAMGTLLTSEWIAPAPQVPGTGVRYERQVPGGARGNE